MLDKNSPGLARTMPRACKAEDKKKIYVNQIIESFQSHDAFNEQSESNHTTTSHSDASPHSNFTDNEVFSNSSNSFSKQMNSSRIYDNSVVIVERSNLLWTPEEVIFENGFG
jgi:hypothetical protein